MAWGRLLYTGYLKTSEKADRFPMLCRIWDTGETGRLRKTVIYLDIPAFQ